MSPAQGQDRDRAAPGATKSHKILIFCGLAGQTLSLHNDSAGPAGIKLREMFQCRFDPSADFPTFFIFFFLSQPVMPFNPARAAALTPPSGALGSSIQIYFPKRMVSRKAHHHNYRAGISRHRLAAAACICFFSSFSLLLLKIILGHSCSVPCPGSLQGQGQGHGQEPSLLLCPFPKSSAPSAVSTNPTADLGWPAGQ